MCKLKKVSNAKKVDKEGEEEEEEEEKEEVEPVVANAVQAQKDKVSAKLANGTKKGPKRKRVEGKKISTQSIDQ